MAPVSSLMIKPLRMLGALYCVSVCAQRFARVRLCSRISESQPELQKRVDPIFLLGVATHCNKCTTIASHIEIRSVRAQFHSSSKQFRPDALTIGTQPKTQIIKLVRSRFSLREGLVPPPLLTCHVHENNRKVILIRSHAKAPVITTIIRR